MLLPTPCCSITHNYLQFYRVLLLPTPVFTTHNYLQFYKVLLLPTPVFTTHNYLQFYRVLLLPTPCCSITHNDLLLCGCCSSPLPAVL